MRLLLSLTLLVSRILLADDTNNALSLDDLAAVAHLFD
jgi:hypothetical protein